MTRRYTEEELNDPHLFDNIDEEEKQESYKRALSFSENNKGTLSAPVRKNKKRVPKIKFISFDK